MRALVRVDGRLYVGGEGFTKISGKARSNLAAFNTIGGGLLPWDAGVRGAVYALAADPTGKWLYVNGSFERIGGALRRNFAAVSLRTGHANAFAPNPDTNRQGDSVAGFAVARTRVYAWGYFSHIGGKAAYAETAALDPHSGRLLSRKPTSGGGSIVSVVAGDTIYVGDRLGGAPGSELSAFIGSTGTVLPWAPRVAPQLGVEQIAVASNRIVAALAKDRWDPGPRQFAAYDRDSGRTAWLSPARLNGYVNAIASDGTSILVGGYIP